MSIRTRLAIVLAAVVLPVLLLAGLVAGVLLPRALVDGQRRDVDRATVALATALGTECWALGDRAEVIALAVANGRPPATVLAEETRGGLGAERGYAVILRGGTVLAASPAAPRPTPRELPTTRCSTVTDRAGALLAERVDLTTTQGRLSVLVVEPLTPGRLDALARQAAVDDVRTVLLCGGGVEVHPSRDTGTGSIVRTVEAGQGRPCAVQGSAPDPTGGVRAWLPLLLIALVLLLAAGLVRWLARELTGPLLALSRGARRIAEGDLSVRLPEDRGDEVGDLAREFNAMAGELDRRHTELTAGRERLDATLHSTAATLQRTHDLDGLLAALCALAETATGSAAATVWLREGSAVRVRVVHPIGTARPATGRVPVGAGLVGRCVDQRRVVRTDDAAPDGAAVLAGRLCAAPLVSGDDVVGVLVVERAATAEPYADETADLLALVAGPAGVAIDNAMLHRAAQRQSVIDPLTGAGNLRMLTSTLGREVVRARKFGRQVSLLVVDIDRFRRINDQRGHSVGDGVLTALTARLGELVSPVDLVARYGGEELAVLVPEQGAEGAAALAQRILADLRTRPLQVGDQSIPITCSIGVATWPDDAGSAAELLAAADAAMVAAKDRGRDRTVTAGSVTGLH
ncbi:GGDEF domain-containing protein [Arsenicicoccus sp. oral taxon 190]|uniref:GGDEF domain-containing protein n=1 Tax=Arsenicicoccus sp. oral taxon 190 TaxID=1658671 RepID=UPI00067A1B08|nr:GGDEF domain-containing protein [Arsenicicoccus sp. oral taxon 190]AKT50219.1 hypothetical protein ADJ73_00760 [Arsenicicoccus sp. oral taxon 190]